MKKNIFTIALVTVLCAAISVGAVFVKRYKRGQLMEEVNNSILADAADTSAADAAEEYPMYTVTGDEFVSMYRTASEEAEEINKIYPGSIVEFMGDAADGFAYIRGKGSSMAGYVKKEYLEKSEFVYSLSGLTVVDTDSSTYSYEELQSDLKQLEEKYESFSYSAIAKTVDGREIYKVSVGDAPRRILIYGALNGTDYMTTQLIMKQAEYYAHYISEGMYNGYRYSDLIQNVSFDFIPMANPDGVSISQWGADIILDGNICENVKNTFYTDRSYGYTDDVKTTYYTSWKANANGIDINRNFPVGFENVPALKGMSHAGFKGTVALSEAESSALAQLIDSGDYSAVAGYTAEGGCVTYVGDVEDNEEVMEEFAEDISAFVNYPVNGDASSNSHSGSALLYSAQRGIPTVEIGISTNKAPLEMDDLQEPWIKLRELPIMLAQRYL